MIPVLFPSDVNWFYEHQARRFARDLTDAGILAEAVAPDAFVGRSTVNSDIILVVNFAETLFSANASGLKDQLVERISQFGRRVLVNHDSLLSQWFRSQNSQGTGFFSDVFDICMCPQTQESRVLGMRYQWVPEAFTRAEASDLSPWSAGRPISWAVVGHATADRAALVGAILQRLPTDGFVFCPPLRPFNKGSGLGSAQLANVLRKANLYIWGSHHRFPYHETLRSLDAVAHGAVPAKIDPLFSDQFSLPWVYPSLDALTRRIRDAGLDAMYDDARRFIETHGSIGTNLAQALGMASALPHRQAEPAL